MKFPTNLSINLRNEQEQTVLTDGLIGWLKRLREDPTAAEDAAAFESVLERVQYVDESGIVQKEAEAYVEVGGQKVKDGTMEEMERLFENEVMTHRASVVLYAFEKLKWVAKKSRRAQQVL